MSREIWKEMKDWKTDKARMAKVESKMEEKKF